MHERYSGTQVAAGGDWVRGDAARASRYVFKQSNIMLTSQKHLKCGADDEALASGHRVDLHHRVAAITR